MAHWVDGHMKEKETGNARDARHLQMLQQEEERKLRRRRQLLRSILSVGLVLGIGAAAVYGWNAGWFPWAHPSPPPAPSLVAAPRPAPSTANDAPRRLVTVDRPEPVIEPEERKEPEIEVGKPAEPVVSTAALRRAKEKLAAKEEAVTGIGKDLAEKKREIDADIRGIYGFVPTPRDRAVERSEWRYPCAALESEQAHAASGRGAQVLVRIQNADANLANLRKKLVWDMDMERSIDERIANAKKEREKAAAKLKELEAP